MLKYTKYNALFFAFFKSKILGLNKLLKSFNLRFVFDAKIKFLNK
jgi:hypothetical protein